MEDVEMEQVIFNIIVHAGNAKSNSFQALSLAKDYEFEKASELIKEAKQELLMAHEVQTRLIEDEANGNKQEITLLMVHAQDHLMNASLAMDLITELIGFYKREYEKNK